MPKCCVFEMPEKTAETIDEEGWLHTGDLVTMDERGYTTITGRLRDMIIRGGENIAPAEVEAVLQTHPAIDEAAVLGLEDPEWGHIVAAAVALRPDASATEEELIEHCRDRLATFKNELPIHQHVAYARGQLVRCVKCGVIANCLGIKNYDVCKMLWGQPPPTFNSQSVSG